MKTKIPRPLNKARASVLTPLSPETMAEMKVNGKALAHPKDKADGKPPKAPPKPKRLYEDLAVRVYDGEGAMTVAEAIDLLGWEVMDDEDKRQPKLRDVNGARVMLTKNATNRPFRPGMAARYKQQILTKAWQLNGETLVFDWFGLAQSAQHRLVGFILAVQEWRKAGGAKGKWGKYWKQEPTLECITVHGIDPSPEVVNTLDQGQRRTYGDVLYRSGYFGDGTAPVSLGKIYPDGCKPPKGQKNEELMLPAMGEKTRARLANILAGATRLVWLRSGGKTVSDAPQFPISEGIRFLEDHPRIVYATGFIYGLLQSLGKDAEKRFPCSLAYAAGLFYLMATSGTDPDTYAEDKGSLNFELEPKAKEFWAKFVTGANLDADDPRHVAREMVRGMDASGGLGRDEIVSTIVRAFNAFAEGKKVKPRDLTIKRVEDETTGKPKLAEWPRLGGLDVEEPTKVASEDEVAPPDTLREGSRAGKKWKEGDTAWVKEKDGDHYFGTLLEVIQCEDGTTTVMVEGAEDGKAWEVDEKQLCLSYPK